MNLRACRNDETPGEIDIFGDEPNNGSLDGGRIDRDDGFTRDQPAIRSVAFAQSLHFGMRSFSQQTERCRRERLLGLRIWSWRGSDGFRGWTRRWLGLWRRRAEFLHRPGDAFDSLALVGRQVQ